VSGIQQAEAYCVTTLTACCLCKQQKASEQTALSSSSSTLSTSSAAAAAAGGGGAGGGGGCSQPSTLVDLFVSVEKIMVLNTDLQVKLHSHCNVAS